VIALASRVTRTFGEVGQRLLFPPRFRRCLFAISDQDRLVARQIVACKRVCNQRAAHESDGAREGTKVGRLPVRGRICSVRSLCLGHRPQVHSADNIKPPRPIVGVSALRPTRGVDHELGLLHIDPVLIHARPRSRKIAPKCDLPHIPSKLPSHTFSRQRLAGYRRGSTVQLDASTYEETGK
jgi:hypothetical protein